MRKTDTKHRRELSLQILSFLPAAFMGAVIFGFSSQNAEESSGLSEQVTAALVESANNTFQAGWTRTQILYYEDIWEFWVRKAAHFSEYLLFGVLLCLPLYLCGLTGRQLVFTAIAISACYATSDELHQFLSPGRSPGVRDVVIDTCGASVGILLTRALYRRGKNGPFRGLRRFRRGVIERRRQKISGI